MKLNDNELENLSERFLSIIDVENFALAVIDWSKLGYNTRIGILTSIGFDEDAEDLAEEYCTAAVIIQKKNSILDFNNCWLHISTIGRLPDIEVLQYIKECFLRSEVDFENVVELNIEERFYILGEIIPSIDMREVK